MFQYTITKAGEPTIHYDLHALPLPGSGRLAHTLSHSDLFKELLKLGVPVDPTTGHQQLLIEYAKFRANPSAETGRGPTVTGSATLGLPKRGDGA
jgi:hypothetical protein